MIDLSKIENLKFRLVSNAFNYTLKRPLEIFISDAVIKQLQAVYLENAERGGLIEFESSKGKLNAVSFYEIRNISFSSSSYIPQTAVYESTINSILSRNNLPITLHTHPTKLGLNEYDNKDLGFYLKSSQPDRQATRNNEFLDKLVLPEIIFVSNKGYNLEYDLKFFGGSVFTASYTALSTTQFVSLAAVISLFVFNRPKTEYVVFAIVVFYYEQKRKPIYQKSPNGLKVVLST